MSAFFFKEADKADIRVGDVILHDGIEKTISRNSFSRCEFSGLKIFGDSYNLGYKKVLKGSLSSGSQTTKV